MLTWTEAMSTGVSLLDAHHRMLIEKFNELAVSLDAGEDGREKTGEVLDFLQFYAEYHFRREEQCMTEHRCPAAVNNAEQHRLFLQLFGAFYENWQNGTLTRELAQQTRQELSLWIREHIMNTDRALHSCVSPKAKPLTSGQGHI